MNNTTYRTGYEPRPLQAQIHESLRRFNVLVCHRRFGKTLLCINELIDKALRCDKKSGRYAYVAPTFKAAKDIAWAYLRQYTANLPGVTYYENTAECRFAHNGAVIRLYGVGDDPDALRGLYFDGAVLDEFALMPARVWSEVIRPAMIDRHGWAIFIGTPMGRNVFTEFFEGATLGWPDGNGRLIDPDWYGARYRASETGVLPPGELDAARRQMTQDEYDQEFECSFEAAIPGAYYGVLMREAMEDGRIGKVSHDRALKVDTWWDLGYTDATTIWFTQRVGSEIHVIDYYEAHTEPPSHYASVLQERARENHYVYGRHIWPHDAGAKTLASGGRTIAGLFADLGLVGEIQPATDRLVGIAQVRNILPRCWFDEGRCYQGIEALRAYRKEEQGSRGVGGRPHFKPTPLHDWASHAADAFRIGAGAYVSAPVSKYSRNRSGASARRSAWAA